MEIPTGIPWVQALLEYIREALAGDSPPPPCVGGVLIGRQVFWKCIDGTWCLRERNSWRCPDGKTRSRTRTVHDSGQRCT
jgi:hypothetical protein